MENETNVIVETPNDTVEETVVETQENPVVQETTEDSEVNIEQLQATNKKLYERAKKAEADLKAMKGSKPAETKATQPPNIEEAAVIAALQVNGMSDELIDQLKKVAKVQGTSLLKAQNDSIFIAVKEKFEKDQKQKNASVGASRGSSALKPKKDLTTPGLTREEHMRMAKEL